MFGAHRGVMPIVARLARRDASTTSGTAMDASLGGAFRWLELGDGVLRRGWIGLVTGRG
jgi:hypothetical protein